MYIEDEDYNISLTDLLNQTREIIKNEINYKVIIESENKLNFISLEEEDRRLIQKHVL